MVLIQEIVYLKKDRAYIINLDEFEPIATHWIEVYQNAEDVTYFVIDLQLNIFQEKLENSLETKILQQTFIEYKHMIL